MNSGVYNFSVSIRAKLVHFISFMVLVSVGLFFLIGHFTIDRSRSQQKAIFTRQVIARIGAVLDAEMDRVAVLCQDWAVWDAMYEFVVRPSQDFRLESLPETILEESRLNLALVLDNRGRPVHLQGFDPATGEETGFGWGARPPSQLEEVIVQSIAAPQSQRMICHTLHGPLLLVSAAITRTDGSGPAIGRLVLGRLIGPDFSAPISRALQERTELWLPSTSGEARWRQLLSTFSGGEFRFHESESALSIDHLVRDCRGQPAFVVHVRAQKRIFFILQRASRLFFALLLVGVLAAAIFFFFFVQHQLLGRLQRITRHMDNIAGLSDLTMPLDEKGRDEIARLAGHINRMQERLRLEVERQRKLERNVVMNEKLVATGRLAANVAHEINNPLFAISNAIQVIKRELPAPATEVAEVIHLAEREIRRVRGITRNLHDFTRLAPGEFRSVDMLETISAAIQVLKWGRGLRRTRVMVEPPAGSFPVIGNADSLQQVFMNLLRNASEAMSGGGRVVVSLFAGDGTWDIHVRDEGPGFAPGMESRLFEPFLSSRDVRGVGLGLYISYQIVNRHNGSLSLQRDGRPGAHLLVRLPRCQEAAHD